MNVHQLVNHIHSIPTPELLSSEFDFIKNQVALLINKGEFQVNYFKNHIGRELFRKLYNFGLSNLIKGEYDSGFRPIDLDFISDGPLDFLPSDDINLSNWWDSNNIDPSNINGSTLVTWNNQVAGGKSLICPEPINPPSPTIVNVNGVNVVRMDSISDRLAAGTTEVFNYPGATFSILIATKITESPLASNDCLWFSSHNVYQYRAGSTNQWQPQIGNNYSAINNTGSTINKLDGNMQIHTLIFDASNEKITVKINQVAVISDMSYPSVNHFSSSTNRNIFFYSNAGQNSTMAGDLGDIILTKDISDSNLSLHEQYLANKFGINL